MPSRTDLVAVTVAGPSLTWADAYATATMAMGDRPRSWLTDDRRDADRDAERR